MKKKLFLICLSLLGMGSIASAQVKITGQAGLNFASVSTDDSDVAELLGSKLGFSIGAQIEKDINDKLYFTAGANYSSKGYAVEFTTDIPGFYKIESTGTSSLNYLEIPINLGFRIGDRVTLQAGPYIGFLAGVSNYYKTTETDYMTGETVTAEDTDNDKTGISSTDFGLNLGAGFNITDDLSIKLNYGLGMADLNDDASATYYLKNNVTSVGIAYTFKK